jgi:hypothetical protein
MVVSRTAESTIGTNSIAQRFVCYRLMRRRNDGADLSTQHVQATPMFKSKRRPALDLLQKTGQRRQPARTTPEYQDQGAISS